MSDKWYFGKLVGLGPAKMHGQPTTEESRRRVVFFENELNDLIRNKLRPEDHVEIDSHFGREEMADYILEVLGLKK
jgi:hypothetical protein